MKHFCHVAKCILLMSQ